MQQDYCTVATRFGYCRYGSGLIMKQIDLMFIDWADNNGIIGDIVRAVVGAIVIFIILSPFAILLSPVFYQ